MDFGHRARLLTEVDALLAADAPARESLLADWLTSWPDGRIKLAITAAGLRLRRELPALFLEGSYVPLTTEVTVAAGVVAFARILEDRAVVFAAPRIAASMVTEGMVAPIGADSVEDVTNHPAPELAERTFRHEVTGAEIKPMVTGSDAWLFAGQVFAQIPVGILRTV